MDLTKQIFNYCERGTDPSFWAEPLNAVTNASFIIAALIGLVLALKNRRLDGPVGWSILVAFVVGCGSFLFHTYATVWAAIADTAPIMIFILSYFVIAMRCYAGLRWGAAGALTIAFLLAMVAVSALLRPLNDYLHGSQSYIPAFLALLGVGLWLRARAHPAGRWLIAVAGIFAVSLTFRSLDQAICDATVIGTHWLWHVLNGVVLGTLIVALIRHGRRGDPA